MTEEMNPLPGTDPEPEPAAHGEVPPAGAPPAPPGGEEARSSQGREWLAQLQQMIDRVTTEAGPVARDVAVKAAELAAVAGEKAGPIARRAADVTGDVGTRVAQRSRRFADDMRHRGVEGDAPAPVDSATAEPGEAPAREEEPPA